jgi:alkylation response protein AidB-like acyl-CoA dehydrogenase
VRPPHELIEALADADLLGLNVPEEWGGVGGGMTDEIAMMEALGRAGIPGFQMIITNFARVPVMRYGSGPVAQHFVASTMRVHRRPCFALTEPDAGTNAFDMRTTATPDADGWRISGQKVYISGAQHADQMLLVTRTAGQEAKGGRAAFSVFVVDLDTPGITLQQQKITAARPDTQSQVFLDDVRVPASRVVGEPGRAAGYLFNALNCERMFVAAMVSGLGGYLLDKGVEFARTRAPFGRPIGAYQSVAHPMARAKIQLEAARMMMYESAAAFDDSRDEGALSNMAKFLATEGSWAAVDAVIQAHGGMAFEEETDLVDFLTFLRLVRIAPVNNEMVLNYVSERVLGLPRSY